MAADSATAEAWPLKLEQTQGLRLKRGDVIVLDRTPHVIVGFDGRDEAYLCWLGSLDGKFDTRRVVRVPRKRAHGASRDFTTRWSVPPLPAIDHMGRLAGEAGPKVGAKKPGSFSTSIQWPSYPTAPEPKEEKEEKDEDARTAWRDRSSAQGGSCGSQCDSKDGPLSHCASSAATTRAASQSPLPSARLEQNADVPPSRCGTASSTRATSPSPLNSARLEPRGRLVETEPSIRRVEPGRGKEESGPVERQSTGEVPLVLLPPQAKACVLCVFLRGLAAAASTGLLRLGAWLARAATTTQQPTSGRPGWQPRLKNEDFPGVGYDGSRMPATTRGQEEGAISSPNSRALAQPTPRRDTFEDLQITIPIVRPPGWQEVQPLLAGKAVTFDERGLKETMTVKASRWCCFVDRQRLKLEREIREARGTLKRQESTSSAGTWGEGDSEDLVATGGKVVEDDITELEQMVERMDDWKDLSRYSGKSISMASTRRGNEMKIHVIAFAEREDGGGVDFMRLCYRKSVEVRSKLSPGRSAPPPPAMGISSFGTSLRHIVPFLTGYREEEAPQEQWIQLLQRPDVAKFTIALAFRNALENDGVHFQFCDARLDDPTTI